jgi:hypothetical protein
MNSWASRPNGYDAGKRDPEHSSHSETRIEGRTVDGAGLGEESVFGIASRIAHRITWDD